MTLKEQFAEVKKDYSLLLAKERIVKAKERLYEVKDQDPAVYKEVVTDDVYRVPEQAVSGKHVLDVGANIGIFALLALSKGAESVVCVEANPETAEKLSKNLEGLPCTILNIAVLKPGQNVGYLHGEAGQCEVWDHKNVLAEEGPDRPVDGRTFSSILAQFPKVNVLKMDIEGCEFDALLYAPGTDIVRFDPIYIEIHGMKHEEGSRNDLGRDTQLLQSYIKYFGYEETHRRPLYWWTWNKNVVVSCKPIPLDVFRYERIK
jgi:FkbM family methyltransferase